MSDAPNPQELEEHPEVKERPWKWVVCFASFWINGVVFGILNVYGVLINYVEQTFTEGGSHHNFVVALVGSVAIGITFVFSPLSSFLARKFGFYQTCAFGALLSTVGLGLSSIVDSLVLLYLTYSVMMGLGFSLVYTPSLGVLGHHFQQNLGLANGLAALGSGLFTIILPLILTEVLKRYDFHITMKFLAVLAASLIVCSFAFSIPITKFQESAQNRRSHSVLYKNKRYIIWTTGFVVGSFGYFVPFFFLVKYARSFDLDGQILVSCIGITSCLSRPIYGKISDYPKLNPYTIQQIAFVVFGILTMLLAAAKSLAWLITITLLLGLCDGGIVALVGPIAFSVTSKEQGGQAIGYSLGLLSIPLCVGPPIAGFILDKTDSYTLVFIIAGIPPLIAALFMMSYYVYKPKEKEDDASKEGINKSQQKTEEPSKKEKVTDTVLSKDVNENDATAV